MTRFAPVYRALGMIIMLFGLTMLAPLILSYVVDDGAQAAYDEAFGLTMLSGLFLWYRYRRCKRELAIRDGFLMVVLVWTVLPAFAAQTAPDALASRAASYPPRPSHVGA